MSKKTFFQPRPVNDYFLDICAIPHSSGQEEGVRQYIIGLLQQYNQQNPDHPVQIIHSQAEAPTPGERVIVLRKEAHPSLQGKPTIILHAHLDMVCIPDEQIFPLHLLTYTDETGTKWLKAGGEGGGEGTSLGADNGIGVATALAILTDTSQPYGPIEVLLTVQEETDLAGAREFNLNWLSGSFLITLDSETHDTITYGSAGGSDSLFRWKPKTIPIPHTCSSLSLHISGLKGGHSGMNIADGSANAIKLFTTLLNQLRPSLNTGFNLVEIRSGAANNAIPNQLSATFSFDTNQTEPLIKHCHALLATLKQLYQNTDPDFTWNLTAIENPTDMIDTADSNNLLDLLTQLPNGPIKQIGTRPEVVETSANLAVIDASPEMITIQCSTRSSNEHALSIIENLHKTIAQLFGLEIFLDLDTFTPHQLLNDEYPVANSGILIISGNYPGWDPDEKSHLLAIAKEVYQKKYPGQFRTQIIHAGLECGCMVKRFLKSGRKMDCIAIGPNIQFPHSPYERLNTSSVLPFYQSLIDIIKRIQS